MISFKNSPSGSALAYTPLTFEVAEQDPHVTGARSFF